MAARTLVRTVAASALGLGLAAALAVAGAGCAADPALRSFPDRPVAWHEHDTAEVATPPRPSGLGDLDSALLVRDSLAAEVDRTLALEGASPARDVNAADDVPCSTWFCPRNHLRPVTPEAIAAGTSGIAPRLPLRIVKGKDRGAALGFQVVDADGRKFLLKLDPVGHAGLATAAEMVCSRLFYAAGYNVPSSFVVDLGPGDLLLDPQATFQLYKVQKRPLTLDEVLARLAGAARTADGRLHGVAVSWLPGKILGAFDMQGRRADDPNDRIRHEDRRSLRASFLLFAWLAIFDASAINTLDSYVEENGRHFVRHYIIDFGAGIGSATNDVKGPHDGGQHVVEVGRTMASVLSLGLYRRPYQSQRDVWTEVVAAHPSVGWFPAEQFDVGAFRTNRKVPAHLRMTARDAYWGAKLVTSFSNEQITAVVGAAQLAPREAAYLAHALRVRRDLIGRLFLTAVTAVEAPAVVAGAGAADARVCFDDLVVAREYAPAARVRYIVGITDDAGRRLGDMTVPAQGAHSCVPAPAVTGGYRVVAIRAELASDGGWARARTARIHIQGGRVVGLERDE
jgi:hypothetical protein